MKKYTSHFIGSFFVLTVIVVWAIIANTVKPCTIDYSDAHMWYVSTDSCAVADIFYVCSTETSDWVNAKGDTMHFADLSNAAHRAALLCEMRGVDLLVRPQGCNFYAPYYRQATIEGLLRDTTLFRTRCAQAGEDVARAFRYYMKELNGGRKFVLMGYSQGGYIVVDLLKGLSTDELQRLVAAYVIGYEVTAEDLASVNVRAARGATDTGVTICYNSVSEPGAEIPILSGKTAIGINPVNWCTDATEATYVFDFGGACDTVSARLDTIGHLTIITGYDGACPLVPFVGRPGNYHCLEIPLYYRFLRDNIALRCKI